MNACVPCLKAGPNNPFIKRLAAALVIVAATLETSSGDTVFFKDGTKREGKVVAEGDEEILLSVSLGEMSVEVTIPKAGIERIERAATRNERLLLEYRERLGKMEDTNAQAWHELGLWCDQQPYLSRQAERAFEMAVELDSEHAGARQKLGHVKYDGRWMTAEQVLQAQQTQKAAEQPEDRDRTRELVDAAFQQSAEFLRDRTIRAEAELVVEKKMRREAERKIEELEDRLERLERDLYRPKGTYVERRPIIILGDRCCRKHPHPGVDCRGNPLPQEKPSDSPKTETRMSPSTEASN